MLYNKDYLSLIYIHTYIFFLIFSLYKKIEYNITAGRFVEIGKNIWCHLYEIRYLNYIYGFKTNLFNKIFATPTSSTFIKKLTGMLSLR